MCLTLAQVPALAGDGEPVTRSDADYLIDTWETEQGLPENSATAMVRGADGLLWFGTFGGLVRFDGVTFDIHQQSNTPGLPSSGIVNLHRDRSNRLWISTYGGLVTLSNGQWRRFDKEQGWIGDYARSFAERGNGDLLIGTFDAHLLEFTGESFRTLPQPPGCEQRGVAVWADEQGKWWAMASTFVGYWDGARWRRAFDVAADEEAWGGRAIDGSLWLLRGRRLAKIAGGVQVAGVELSESPGGVWGIHEDSAGHVWLATLDRGVCRVAMDGTMRRFALGAGLTANGVRFVHEDHEGNLWIGTSGGGLSRFRPRRVRAIGAEAGLTQPNVKSVSAAPDGGIWIATYGAGLFRWDGQRASRVALPPGSVENIQSVLADRAGRTWVGQYAAALAVIGPDGGRLIADDANGGGNGIALMEDAAGRVWVSGGQHLAVHEGGAARLFGNEPGKPLFGVIGLAQTNDGAIWAANARLHKLIGDRFQPQWQPAKNVRITSITADRDGSLWVGLSDALLRLRDGRMDRVDGGRGLNVAGVLGMVEDRLGHYWLATGDGVLRVRRADLHAAADGSIPTLPHRRFDTTDGLPSPHCSAGRQPVCAMGADGRIWFATLKGAAVIDPSHLRFNAEPPVVRFTSVTYRRPSSSAATPSAAPRAASEQAALDLTSATLELPPGSRQIEVRFAATSFTSTRRVKYEVSLDGEPWIALGARREVTYHDLPPGDHVLRARACNHDGVWSEAGQSLAFTVLPFVWQTGWFRGMAGAGLVIVVAGGGWMLAHVRQRRRRREQDRFRLLVEASPSAMLLVDGAGRIALANAQAERVFGYPRQMLLGEPAGLLVPAHLADACRKMRDSAAAPGVDRDAGDLVGRRRDGSEFPVEVHLSLVPVEQGAFVLASISDISERQRAELEAQRQRNELAHLSRVNLLGELSGSLAHELNQPLASILSNAQAAQRFLAHDHADLAEVRDILKDIVDEDKRAGEIIRRLRALLKKGEVQRGRMNLNETVHEVMRLMRSDVINQGVRVILELCPGLPMIEGDRVQLQQVLLNLMMNACDALSSLPAGLRAITVSTAPSDDPPGALLSVADRGVGIPPDRLERIFDPFVTSKPAGMGMGLAVCRTIAAAHGGKLWAENNPDGGAILHLALPACPEP